MAFLILYVCSRIVWHYCFTIDQFLHNHEMLQQLCGELRLASCLLGCSLTSPPSVSFFQAFQQEIHCWVYTGNLCLQCLGKNWHLFSTCRLKKLRDITTICDMHSCSATEAILNIHYSFPSSFQPIWAPYLNHWYNECIALLSKKLLHTLNHKR